MEEIKCGDHAKTVIGKIPGMITGVLNRFGRMQYDFSYFVNGESKSVWMDKAEFIITTKEEWKAGY